MHKLIGLAFLAIAIIILVPVVFGGAVMATWLLTLVLILLGTGMVVVCI